MYLVFIKAEVQVGLSCKDEVVVPATGRRTHNTGQNQPRPLLNSARPSYSSGNFRSIKNQSQFKSVLSPRLSQQHLHSDGRRPKPRMAQHHLRYVMKIIQNLELN